jgi:hypothetical protein
MPRKSKHIKKNPSISENIKIMKDLKNIKDPDKLFYESMKLIKNANKLSLDRLRNGKISINKFNDILKRRNAGLIKLKEEYKQKEIERYIKEVIDEKIEKKIKVIESEPQIIEKLIDLPTKEFSSKQKFDYIIDNYINSTKKNYPNILTEKDNIILNAYKMAFKKDRKIFNIILFVDALNYVNGIVKNKSSSN